MSPHVVKARSRQGTKSLDLTVPEFMKYEELPPHGVKWDVPDAALDSVLG